MGYPVHKPQPTAQKVIKVAYVNPRKDGQFSASIKDSAGALYWVAEDMLDQFEPHKVFTIEFQTSAKGHHTIVGVERVSEPEPAAVAQKVAAAVAQAPRPQSVARAKDPTPERIFVCGGLNAAITSHQCNVKDRDDIIFIVQTLRQAWTATLSDDEAA